MSRYVRAEWKPVEVNYNPGGCVPRLLMAHIMQGTLDGTDSWFRNPAAQVSSHFGVGRDGTVVQWVDTDDLAWHAAAANAYAIGVEHEGWSGEPLTDAQIDATGQLLQWANHLYPAVAMWENIRPFTGRGVTWHGLGGVQWGNHPECPGSPIVAQIPEIIAHAQGGSSNC